MSIESHLYLVEIVGAGVKVGISRHPAKRIAAHTRDAAASGRAVGRTWVSAVPHINARQNESAIKGLSRREYLDRSFEDCLAQAESLPAVRAAANAATASPVTEFLSSLFPQYGEWLNGAGRR